MSPLKSCTPEIKKALRMINVKDDRQNKDEDLVLRPNTHFLAKCPHDTDLCSRKRKKKKSSR